VRAGLPGAGFLVDRAESIHDNRSDMNGALVIDKPAGWTSHDVVGRVRRLLGERSVGHLGTLDPMATGVLPLVLGRMTRLAQFYGGAEKHYDGVVRLGFATDTYDATGDPTGEPRTVRVSAEQVEAAAARFRGAIEQTPPPFSAKKVAGVPAYKLARKKKDVELKAVKVEVRELTILEVDGERVQFRARVSAGTYLRSIAHELGAALGVGGHLESLRRTASGEFLVEDAHTLEQLEAAAQAGEAEALLIHPRRMLPEMPSVTANEEQAARIATGQAVNLPEMSRAKLVKVFRGQSDLICIAQRVAGTLFHPKIVLMDGR
jgi:tRNA pseudouridine55 synthase